MATTVALVGGPCDGQEKTIDDATLQAGHLTCGGRLYTRTDAIHVGDLITFATSDAIAKATSGAGPNAIFQSNVYKSWGDIQRSANRNLPTALHRIQVSQTLLLQALTHKRRVRR